MANHTRHTLSFISEGCEVNQQAYNPVEHNKARLVHSGSTPISSRLDILFCKKKNKRGRYLKFCVLVFKVMVFTKWSHSSWTYTVYSAAEMFYCLSVNAHNGRSTSTTMNTIYSELIITFTLHFTIWKIITSLHKPLKGQRSRSPRLLRDSAETLLLMCWFKNIEPVILYEVLALIEVWWRLNFWRAGREHPIFINIYFF